MPPAAKCISQRRKTVTGYAPEESSDSDSNSVHEQKNEEVHERRRAKCAHFIYLKFAKQK